jgi:hypothetical protein
LAAGTSVGIDYAALLKEYSGAGDVEDEDEDKDEDEDEDEDGWRYW